MNYLYAITLAVANDVYRYLCTGKSSNEAAARAAEDLAHTFPTQARPPIRCLSASLVCATPDNVIRSVS